MPIFDLWRDPIVLLLLLASGVSWVIIVERLITFSASKRADRAFVPGKPEPPCPLAAFHTELARHAGAGREYIITILDAAIRRQRQRLEGPLPILGVIGSTAPYVGLLGTVIGIINAFQAIEAANNMSPSVVSGGIASALVATATGLAVAIPAVAAHHLLSAAISRRVNEWESTVATWLPDPSQEEQHSELVTHTRK